MTTAAEIYNEAKANALEATGDEDRAHDIALKAATAVDPAKLQVKCPKCGTGNNPKHKKCSKCKNDLTNAKTPPPNNKKPKGNKPGTKPLLFGTKKEVGAMVQCSNCGTKTKSGPTGTKKCPNCGGAVGNPPKKTNKKAAKLKIDVEKVDEDEGLAFGWAYVSELGGEVVEDHSGESIDIEDLEKGVYLYNESERMGGEMHVEMRASRLIPAEPAPEDGAGH